MEWDVIEIEQSKEVDSFMNISMFTKYMCSLEKGPLSENMILMEYDDFVADLYKSFKYNSQRILTLFKVDVPRETLIINGVGYNSPKKAFREINKLTKEVKLRKVIYMLCTQAVMFIPCYILTHTYCQHEGYYLAELREGEREAMKVDIKMDTTSNGVDISKTLRIFYLENGCDDVTYSRIKFNIHVEFGQYVVLTWTNKK